MFQFELIEILKWPVVVIFIMFMFIRGLEKIAKQFAEVGNRFAEVAEHFVDRDSIAIARVHANAVADGVLDTAGAAGHQTLFSYFFWWPTPRRKSVQGTLSLVRASQDDES
jgi:hypothetical protein